MQEKLSKKEIGLRIKTLRIENGLSQEEMATILTISRSNYSQIETGLHYPSFELLAILARNYCKSYEWLLHGEENLMPKLNHEPDKEISRFFYQQNGKILKILSTTEYLTKLNDHLYIDDLPTFTLPLVIENERDCYRAFCIGNSCYLKGIYPNDTLVGKLLTKLSQIDLHKVYIVVTFSEIIYCRIVNIAANGEGIVCNYDGSNKVFQIEFFDIQEIWLVKGKYSTVI